MLKVKTYIDKSSINGIGLFSLEFIPKETVVWDLDYGIDIIFSFIGENEFLNKYCYKDQETYILCVDDARFMNHSITPNTSNGIGNQTISNKDIQIGEEITCNYFEIDDDGKTKLDGITL
jgi:SET domain-containing protein